LALALAVPAISIEPAKAAPMAAATGLTFLLDMENLLMS
jgi:hypothetical protein